MPPSLYSAPGRTGSLCSVGDFGQHDAVDRFVGRIEDADRQAVLARLDGLGHIQDEDTLRRLRARPRSPR